MITVGELQAIVELFDDDKVYDIGIERVFSWRGSYCEPCFAFGKDITGKHMKKVVQECLTETFTGWKGGEFDYEGYQDANFEADEGNYTDEAYFVAMMVKYKDEPLMQKIMDKVSEGYLGSYGEEL